ncbi:low molecular weight phosphotyrosine protein phosphatase [Lutimaribacter sp. EGI FJ00015]|uniref:Low molecular weight phosphotyrosine protein phosphatase n=1 Tax=Lutimaribacter degradans TaxID=2945989 RepID=A0ACC5ZT41_9RHOB|nr:low molecular weight protein-tyrosine-phosphatase [Lutimaribacter sp. EGI FJ00013]MCM2561499.1 low molecular weight phosphotyrosine protein phosphatase [Lutimaribacter sp. EGI FJ00013]MCO0612790.1 low molecular weight phosphotyrosine protein phosphatase [Lutimaribacter sp. EGI FJ00015]MCO0635448.1 low molecular weight phosphotyrosine protein phosphatase [Lutimaribacter sp. EGI FJ00014]
MSKRILFVCLGNICRSPSAHAVTRALAPDWQIDSAGTSDWHVGEPPYAPMQQAARARGLEMADLRARQFTVQDFDAFDMIVAMDDSNLARIEALRPAGNTTPVRLLTEFGDGAADHVPDPYYTRDFDGCLDLIETCARGLITHG